MPSNTIPNNNARHCVRDSTHLIRSASFLNHRAKRSPVVSAAVDYYWD